MITKTFGPYYGIKPFAIMENAISGSISRLVTRWRGTWPPPGRQLPRKLILVGGAPDAAVSRTA
jgi:hypothetical protein